MDFRRIVIEDYQEFVQMDLTIPSELRHALRAHERVPVFVERMVEQLNKLPKNRKYDRAKIKMLVHEMTNQFIFLVKTKAEQAAQSELESLRQKAEQQRLEDLEKTSEGTPSGIYGDLYEELGVIQEDTLTKEAPDEGQDGQATSGRSKIIT